MTETAPQTIDEYFTAYGQHHVAKAATTLSPLHRPGVDPLPEYQDVERLPYEPQSHVIAAAIKMLDAQKRGFIVGQMGTGKTIMGTLIVHEHARRSRRKGGSNGKYRALIVCPDHLIQKWKEEILCTIPDAKIVTFDTEGVGCRQLITDQLALWESMRGRRGHWKKPEGPEWVILGRNQSKLMPGKSGLGKRPGGYRMRLVEVEKGGQTYKKRVKQWRCPHCGYVIKDKKGNEFNVAESEKLFTCKGKFGREVAKPESGTCGLDRTRPLSTFEDKPTGKIVKHQGKDHKICACNQPLWQYTAQPRRWAPAQFISSKMRYAFTYLIIDEVHQAKGDATVAQATATAKLISCTRYCLCLTGTLIGGKASDLFPMLFRLDGEQLREEGFEWGHSLPFTRKYGRIERVETTKHGGDSDSGYTSRSRSMRKDGTKIDERPAPGIMPGLFGRQLIDKSIFINLDDMACNLPRMREYVGGEPNDTYTEEDLHFYTDCLITMNAEQYAEYMRIENALTKVMKEQVAVGRMSILGAMLQTLLGYPDHPWDWKAPTGIEEHLAVGYWDKPGNRDPENWVGVIQPADLDKDIIYPKEQALIDVCNKEIDAGNQVWVFVNMTGIRDVQPRLKALLEKQGHSVAILRPRSVPTKDRLAWINKTGRFAKIVISHPQPVETGLDFYGKDPFKHNYNAICFYETGYNIFTLRQAAARAWRLGQTKNCRVYYLHYAETMQLRAMQLIARKMVAAKNLDGDLNVEGLTSMADDCSATMALARSLCEKLDDVDVGRCWAKLGESRSASSLEELGRQSIEENAIDELDFLPMEQGLIAQTLLDHDSADGPRLSRKLVAKMFDELFDASIDDFANMEF